jgi:predicted RNA-binding protein with PIN domain
VAEATFYLFDGFNLLHAGGFADAREMTDKLASFVAGKGARGVLVFDGSGDDLRYGPLEVRFAEDADTLLERLAAEHRDHERVCLVSSDSAVRGTSGQAVMKLSSATFTRDFQLERHAEHRPMRIEDKLDPEIRERLERLRRGEDPSDRPRPNRKRH